MKLKISTKISEQWDINRKRILDSHSKNSENQVFKFCYDPSTGEFLCDTPPVNHASMIKRYGQKEFNDYVRGIYFRVKKIVYLRQHEKEQMLLKTKYFLRTYGVTSNIRIIWGPKAAEELSNDLRGL